MIRRPVAALAVALLVAIGACSDHGDDRADATTSTTAAVGSTPTTSGDHPSSTTTTTKPEVETALALRGDGLGVAAFGEPTDDVVKAVTSVLGAPTSDKGWETSEPGCPGDRLRWVHWDGLHLLFTESAGDKTPGGQFESWDVDGSPPALAMRSGFGFDATADDAHDLYGQDVERFPADDPFPAYLVIHVDDARVIAYLDDHDTVTNLHGGGGCGE